MVMGVKVYKGDRRAYLDTFFDSAKAATAPDPDKAADRYECAKESGTVASQTIGFPCSQGTRVKPSGRLPSDLEKHDGSRHEGTSAEEKARWRTSLVAP